MDTISENTGSGQEKASPHGEPSPSGIKEQDGSSQLFSDIEAYYRGAEANGPKMAALNSISRLYFAESGLEAVSSSLPKSIPIEEVSGKKATSAEIAQRLQRNLGLQERRVEEYKDQIIQAQSEIIKGLAIPEYAAEVVQAIAFADALVEQNKARLGIATDTAKHLTSGTLMGIARVSVK